MRPPSVRRRLHLHLHGYPAVAVDGREVPLKLRRGLALLALLAELQRKVSRAQAAALLWPDAAEALGRTRLRRLVHEVHGACDAEPITGDVDALWLDAERWGVTSDVQDVRRLAQGLLAGGEDEATRPGAGHSPDGHPLLAAEAAGLLDGFLLGADTFDDWAAQRRVEHARLVGRALQRLAEREAAQGDAALAIEAAERLIALDPTAESGHAALLLGLGRRRDLAAIEAAYFRCAELLRAEFGIAPSLVLESAYDAARRRAARPAGDDDRGAGTAAAPPRAPIRFAQTADGAVAYSIHGSTGPALVVVPGLLSHIEVALEEPRIRRCVERLAERHRVVLVDRRGTGLSERVGVAPTVDSAVEDIAAVVQALGGEPAWLFGASIGGAIAIAAAAALPGRVAGLVLYAVSPRGKRAPDFPWAMTSEQLLRWQEQLRAGWGGATSLEAFAPEAANDPQVQAWWARMLRSAASQNGVAAILRAFHETEVRPLLPSLRVPTLVIQREQDRIVRAPIAPLIAQAVPGAELLMLPGTAHWWWHGDSEAVIRAIERFTSRPAAAP